MKTYQFPPSVVTSSQPYMILTSYESKNAVESGSKPMSSIALYIPPNALRQTTDANWSGVEGGAIKAGTISSLMSVPGVSKLMDTQAGNVSGWSETVSSIFESAGMFGTRAVTTALEKTTGMLSAGAGVAINNHLAMAYRGPDKFRTHEFAFNFFPKNKDEAGDVKAILTDIQNGMLPRMVGTEFSEKRGRLSKPFFQSPRHWDIEFYANGKLNQTTKGVDSKGKSIQKPGFLFEIKRSVITNMIVNHDPNSVVSFHADGSPVQTTFSLTFQEIELPVSDDPTTAYSKTLVNNPVHQEGTPTYGPYSQSPLQQATQGLQKTYNVPSASEDAVGHVNRGMDILLEARNRHRAEKK
jgi:hypothetical protein